MCWGAPYTGWQTVRQTGQWKESRMGIYRTQPPESNCWGASSTGRQTVRQTGQWKESRMGKYRTQPPRVHVLRGTFHWPTDSKTDWLVEGKSDGNLQDSASESLHWPTDSKTDWSVEGKSEGNLQDSDPESRCWEARYTDQQTVRQTGWWK